MGRKIPAKKHHGVKDPEKQAERRNAKIKLKINETPENIEEQEIPKKLKNLFKKPHKKRGLDDPSLELILLNNKDPTSKIQLRPVKKTPKIKRRPEETDRDLLWRTEVVTRDYMKQKRFEDKYDVDVEKDYKTGAVQIKKRVPFVEDQVNTEPKNKWEKKKLKKMEKIRLEQEERKRLKKEKFKEKKLYKKNKGKKMDEFSVLKQDKIEFGEVAEQPPTLTAKPRKSKSLDMVNSVLDSQILFHLNLLSP